MCEYMYMCVHTEKYFRKLIKLTQNQIVFTILPLIWKMVNTV